MFFRGLLLLSLILLPMVSGEEPDAVTTSTTPSTTTSTNGMECYKYEKNFPSPNFIDAIASDKQIVSCDQCFGYLCYFKSEYVLGNGCRDDFFRSCNIPADKQDDVKKAYTGTQCFQGNNRFGGACNETLCNHDHLRFCFNNEDKISENKRFGSNLLRYMNLTQLDPPPPTSNTETTPDATTAAAMDASTNGSANSKMISFIFLGALLAMHLF